MQIVEMLTYIISKLLYSKAWIYGVTFILNIMKRISYETAKLAAKAGYNEPNEVYYCLDQNNNPKNWMCNPWWTWNPK